MNERKTEHEDGIECSCPACGHHYYHGGEVAEEPEGEVQREQHESFAEALKRRRKK